MPIHSMAVFCGSKAGANPLFRQHATQVGEILAAKGIALVYGGGNKGLMAAVADGALSRQGKVIGVIPHLLSDREHKHEGLTELHLTKGMHERKQLIYDRCDAALALPGGYGTLDELFETITWQNLSIHNKKIFVLNTAGFYTQLLAHIARMQEEGFLYIPPAEQLTVIEEPDALLDIL